MITVSARLFGAKSAALALFIGALSPTLAAQDKLSREINFVRALAKDMRFIELAESEADRLASEFRGAGDQDKIAQLSVEVAYYGARSRSDRSEQRALFKKTVEKSQELIGRSSDAEVKLQAQSTLANATQDFGQFLIEELDIARSESPEQVAELKEEVIDVLKAGKEACRDVRSALDGQRSDPQKEIEFFLMWMKEAVLTREQAKADKENRGVLVDRSVEELEEMVLEAGEESALGLRGLFEIAQCYEVKGEIGEAITWYTDTIDQITTALEEAQEGNLDLTMDMQGFLFGMMQEVYVCAGETMAREGADGTAELFENFRGHIQAFGEEDSDIFDVVSESYGHLMLLAESRWKAESGDQQKVQEALAMTQRINDKHPADYVGVKAKAVLADILALQKTLVSGKLLFEVGKGDLQKKNYESAIKSMRAAIAAMTSAEQKELGMEAYLMLGNAYRRTDRSLEAIIALTEGARRFGDKPTQPPTTRATRSTAPSPHTSGRRRTTRSSTSSGPTPSTKPPRSTPAAPTRWPTSRAPSSSANVSGQKPPRRSARSPPNTSTTSKQRCASPARSLQPASSTRLAQHWRHTAPTLPPTSSTHVTPASSKCARPRSRPGPTPTCRSLTTRRAATPRSTSSAT